MKKILICLGVVWGTIPLAIGQCTIDYRAWNLVFEDNFTSQTAFVNNWNRNVDPVKCAPENFDSKYFPQNSYIDDGYLNIDVNRLSTPTYCGSKPVNYSSGWVTSNQFFRYGLFEA